jgi:hypothetical protein
MRALVPRGTPPRSPQAFASVGRDSHSRYDVVDLIGSQAWSRMNPTAAATSLVLTAGCWAARDHVVGPTANTREPPSPTRRSTGGPVAKTAHAGSAGQRRAINSQIIVVVTPTTATSQAPGRRWCSGRQDVPGASLQAIRGGGFSNAATISIVALELRPSTAVRLAAREPLGETGLGDPPSKAAARSRDQPLIRVRGSRKGESRKAPAGSRLPCAMARCRR